MLYTFIGILIGIVFICIIPKFMEWTDYSSTDWKNKINNHDTRDLKIGIIKKINPNDEVNAKILQILDECENDIAAMNSKRRLRYER